MNYGPHGICLAVISSMMRRTRTSGSTTMIGSMPFRCRAGLAAHVSALWPNSARSSQPIIVPDHWDWATTAIPSTRNSSQPFTQAIVRWSPLAATPGARPMVACATMAPSGMTSPCRSNVQHRFAEREIWQPFLQVPSSICKVFFKIYADSCGRVLGTIRGRSQQPQGISCSSFASAAVSWAGL